MFFYYRKADIEKGKLFLLGIEDKKLTDEELKEQGKVELYRDSIVFEGDSHFVGYPILQGDTIRKATRLELINLKLDELADGEYIENGEIKLVRYDYSLNYVKPVWNADKHVWEDGATDLDRAEYLYRDYKVLDTPLTFVKLEQQGLKQEYIDMMLQTENIIEQLKTATQSTGYSSIVFKQPSEALRLFKEKEKKLNGGVKR